MGEVVVVVRELLASFSLTPNESKVYLFLSKIGPSKCCEIARNLSKNRPHIYRILTKLERINLIEKTLESPTRFVAIPIKDVLDLKIREKQEQTLMLKQTRKEILFHWKEIRETNGELLPEKFALIEGQHRILGKTKQIIVGAKERLLIFLGSSIFTPMVQREIELLVIKKARRKSLSLCILEPSIDLNHRIGNQRSMKKDLPTNILKRILSCDVNLPTRFVVKDEEEALVLIRTAESQDRIKPKEICLWTNSKTIIAILKTLFEKLWQESTEYNLDDILTKRKYSQKTIKEVSKWYIQDLSNGMDIGPLS
jgi:HTH-type transcriptional regulator, sugar sensing transcriptional regulator